MANNTRPDQRTDTRAVNLFINNASLPGHSARFSIDIADGRIRSIGEAVADVNQNDHEHPGQFTRHYVDAQGALAIPGLIDLYTRLREPGFTRKGTIKTEAAAARHAGFTHLLCSPDTEPTVDSVATVDLIQHRAAVDAPDMTILPMAALTPALQGDQLSELATLQAAGCPVASHADVAMANTDVLYSAMEYAASFNMPLVMTARDGYLGINGCAHAGAVATRLGLPQIPVAAETVALTRLIELCRETACPVHVSRLSSARAVRLLAEAKDADLPISCDVGIHHLYFTDDLLDGFDSAFHSAVPFRGHEDRQALRYALEQGLIDAICTDHAPQDRDAGLAPFPGTEPGLSAYDWFIPLMLQITDITTLSLSDVVAKLTSGPARLVCPERSAQLKVEEPACLFLLDNTTTFPDSAPLSLGHNHPLVHHTPESLGLQKLQGMVSATITPTLISHY